jgi:hypothetical protein
MFSQQEAQNSSKKWMKRSAVFAALCGLSAISYNHFSSDIPAGKVLSASHKQNINEISLAARNGTPVNRKVSPGDAKPLSSMRGVARDAVSTVFAGDTETYSYISPWGCTATEWRHDTSGDYFVCGYDFHTEQTPSGYGGADYSGLNGYQNVYCHRDNWSTQYYSEYTSLGDYYGSWTGFSMCPAGSWVTDNMVQHDDAGLVGLIGFTFYCRDEWYNYTGSYTQVDGDFTGSSASWTPWMSREEWPMYLSGHRTCDDNSGSDKQGIVDWYLEERYMNQW